MAVMFADEHSGTLQGFILIYTKHNQIENLKFKWFTDAVFS